MKSLRRSSLLLGTALLLSTAFAAGQPTGSAAAKAAYPLATCVVSGDKLEEGGPMGGPVDYLYKVNGKPDRLIRFCCKDCVKDFEQEPAKFLKKLDEAVAAKAKAAPAPKH
ncbi:MAG: hypothetical protein EXS32_14750 [Opitutus sp.]|nr:hypothetical protein [Opitutus sp.]